jgi:hypothetical protein
MSDEVRGQDINGMVHWDVDWRKWLAARGYATNGSEIVSVVWTVPAPLVKETEDLTGSVARVWVSGVTKNMEGHVIKCSITMPIPSGGANPVVDHFTFELRGIDK